MCSFSGRELGPSLTAGLLALAATLVTLGLTTRLFVDTDAMPRKQPPASTLATR